MRRRAVGHQPLDARTRGPRMNPSTSAVSCASLRSPRMSGACSSDRSRSNAATSAGSSSARITPRLPDSATRLDDARKVDAAAASADRAEQIDRAEPGHRQAGVAQPLARQQLVARGGGAAGGMPGRPSASQRRAPRSPSAGRRRRARRRSASRPRPRAIASTDARLVVEPDRNRRVLPRILEHVAPVGGKHQIDPEPFGRVAERPRLISGRRREEKNSTHHHQHPTRQHPALTLSTSTLRRELPHPTA